MRRAMAVPEGVEDLSKMPAPALKTLADANPRSFPVQMALGVALRKAGQHRRGDAGVRARRGAGAGGRRPGSPHEQMAAIALEKKDRTSARSPS